MNIYFSVTDAIHHSVHNHLFSSMEASAIISCTFEQICYTRLLFLRDLLILQVLALRLGDKVCFKYVYMDLFNLQIMYSQYQTMGKWWERLYSLFTCTHKMALSSDNGNYLYICIIKWVRLIRKIMIYKMRNHSHEVKMILVFLDFCWI